MVTRIVMGILAGIALGGAASLLVWLIVRKLGRLIEMGLTWPGED